MEKISMVMAGKKDRKQLITYLKHYNNKKLTKNRVECYTSHNHTIVAKDKNKIVGLLQWYLKEDPRDGNVEFEEVHVLEAYRGQGIATEIIKFAIMSVKDFLKKDNIKPRKAYLFVSIENKAAIKVYERCGFKQVCNVGKLLSDKANELLYEFRFKS